MALSNHFRILLFMTIFSLLLVAPYARRTGTGPCPSGSQTATDSTTCTINCFRADPVCGVNGVTYSCGCPEAACNHVTVAYRGACRNNGRSGAF
ncbi:hypothetical protein LUZ63_001532 [Rhynchospora breviuscula]|uniref:Kazal-like domain-containing protein n=1 Tax=Rhynchospora breviuscula TaxID=2022672 RepID=A0A9Q0CX14_9POAL|nr:hypothetical protein LUZ63_001532 [Rhynchospora breviuscula]